MEGDGRFENYETRSIRNLEDEMIREFSASEKEFKKFPFSKDFLVFPSHCILSKDNYEITHIKYIYVFAQTKTQCKICIHLISSFNLRVSISCAVMQN